MEKIRCKWCGNDPLYMEYHDTEWGVPEHNSKMLWEKLTLEGFQAGLSWITILKKRESFRPFAGTVLHEHADEWFDMRGLDESPFMMYAVNVAADKIKKIPAVCHVDDTCRVQTVTEEQNKHYYNLIKAFKDITGVPVLFNTSFNLAGDPLVETIDDALVTLYRSKLKYLYLPELGVLVTKTIADPEPPEEKLIVETDTDDIVTSED